MLEKTSIDACIDVITTNHKAYLDANIVTHLDLQGAADKKNLVDRYLSYITDYHSLQKNYLNNAITDLSLADRIGGGITASLTGISVGGLLFAKEQTQASGDLLGAKAITQGGFSALLAASCSALVYKEWSKSKEKPLHVDYNTCIEQMKQAGFSANKYDMLAKQLVTLFHFRECLLLGLLDNDKVNMRTAFKNRYFSESHTAEFDDRDLNLSIEIYFLQQLNTLFNKAFEDIYQMQQQDIEAESHLPSVIHWIKKYFDSDERQKRFTQQMQVAFMNQCMHFLELEMSAPSTIAEYFYITDSLAGLIAAAITTGAFAATIPFIPVAGLVGIAIVSFALTAALTHLTIYSHDDLYYKRNAQNRASIHDMIQQIGSEQKRLTQLIHKTVATTQKDLMALEKYQAFSHNRLIQLPFMGNTLHVLMGSVLSWMREFANRFNDSKFIAIDVFNKIKSIVEKSQTQTTALQDLLQRVMSSTPMGIEDLKELKQYVEDTRCFLCDSHQQAFIESFEVRQKIKEQLLEILSFISLTHPDKGLPDFLVHFYTDPSHKGGLNGLINDLILAKRIAPIANTTVAANKNHPYHALLRTALNINSKLNAKISAQEDAGISDRILRGDPVYRQLLGLPTIGHVPIETLIQINNIDEYLNASFDFLCSLNQYDNNIAWQAPLQNHEEYILYRTLLTKQLACLADVNNVRVEILIKEKIKTFFREKLQANPDIAIDDILHQSWLIHIHKDHRKLYDPLGNIQSIGALESMADAIRVDIAYLSTPVTPEQLINLEARSFLNQNASYPYVFVCLDANQHIIPECSPAFYHTVQQTMTATLAFLKHLETRQLLKDMGVIHIYTQEVRKHITKLCQQMDALLATTKPLEHQIQTMNDLRQTLQAFHSGLPPFPQTTSNQPPQETLLIESIDLSALEDAQRRPLSNAVAHIIHFKSTKPKISTMSVTGSRMTIDQLNVITNALEVFIGAPPKHSFALFNTHSTTPDPAILAATQLRDLLEQLKDNQYPDEVPDWDKQTAFTNNASLKLIIKQHFPNGLAHFFAQERQGLGTVLS